MATSNRYAVMDVMAFVDAMVTSKLCAIMVATVLVGVTRDNAVIVLVAAVAFGTKYILTCSIR